MNTGTIKWQTPYGEAVGVDPPGNNFGIIKDHGPKARLAVTAGGLMFSATIERKIRAFDKDTGKVLWTAPLPDGAEGSPAVYEVDGREYVAVCIRGAYVAFALPSESNSRAKLPAERGNGGADGIRPIAKRRFGNTRRASGDGRMVAGRLG